VNQAVDVLIVHYQTVRYEYYAAFEKIPGGT